MERTHDPEVLYNECLQRKFQKLSEFLRLTELVRETVEREDLEKTAGHLENRDRCIREIDRIDGMINDLLYRRKKPAPATARDGSDSGKILERMAAIVRKALEINRNIESRVLSGCGSLADQIQHLLSRGGGKMKAGIYQTGGNSRFLDVKG
jgi:hypothetical protein